MSFLLKEDGDKIILEQGVDLLLLDSFAVNQSSIYLYDIVGVVANTIIGKYDINGLVSNSSIYLYDITGVVQNTLGGCYDINGAASTAIIKQSKIVALIQNNVEVKIMEKTDGAFHYSAFVFLDNMVAGDVIEIKVYVWDTEANQYELYESPIIRKNDLKGSLNQTIDDKPAFFIPYLPTDRFKVTINQTLGTPKTFNYVMFKTQ